MTASLAPSRCLVQSVDWPPSPRPPIPAAARPGRPGRRPLPAGAPQAAARPGSPSRGLAARRCCPCSRCATATARTFCLTGATPDGCSYTADHFALVIQLLVLGGALLTALLSVDTVKDARPARRRVLVPAAVLRRRRRPAARLPGPGHPDRRPGGHLAARLRAGRPAPRRPALLRGRAEVLPLLGHRDRRLLLGISFVYAATGSCTSTRRRTPSTHVPAPAAHPRQGGRRPDPRRLRLQDRRRPPSTSGSPTPTPARRCRSPPTSPWSARRPASPA